MTHKPEKLESSKRRVGEGYSEPRRGSRTSLKPTLLLVNPEDSVAEKLVEHCDRSRHTYPNNVPNSTTSRGREFTSWFHKPITNIQPDCLITSHESTTPLHPFQTKTQLPSLLLKTQLSPFHSKTRAHSAHAKTPLSSLPVYQSLVNPTEQWNANMQSSFVSIDESQANEQHDDNCWCESCTSARYRAGLGFDFQPDPVVNSVPAPVYSQPVYVHNNIVTFCNQCTMTPRLNDASCGSSKCVVPLLITAEVGTSGTIINTPQASKSSRHNSILKKPHSDTYEDTSCFAKAWFDHKLIASCVDNNGRHGRSRSPKSPRSACLQTLNDHNNHTMQCKLEPDASNRKMLYNEGISDDIAKQLCVMHKKHPPMHDINERACSGLSIGGKCYRDRSDNYIPYSHNINSKYHQNCKKEHSLVKRSYLLHGVTRDECRTLELEPLVFKRSSMGTCLPHQRCISLPKKLLTSEKNIEAFLRPKYNRERPC